MERQLVTRFDMGAFQRSIEEYHPFTGDAIIERYLRSLNTENTRTQYSRSIDSFFDWLYGIHKGLTPDMLVIDPTNAEEYSLICKDKWEKGEIKSSTYNAKIKGIRFFYKWLMLKTTSNTTGVRMFNINPFEICPQVNEKDYEGAEPLSKYEINLMLENPYGNCYHIKERNKLILSIGIDTGIRCEALINAKMSDIKKIGDEYILVLMQKGHKLTRKPITGYYKRLMNWYEDDLLLRGKNDKDTIFNLHPDSANRIIREWAEYSGVVKILKDEDGNILGKSKNISFHSLRTTTAVNVFERTGSYSAVQEILDQDSVAVAKRYVDKARLISHNAEDIVNDAIKNLSKEIKITEDLNMYEDKIEDMGRKELAQLFHGLDDYTKQLVLQKLKKAE